MNKTLKPETLLKPSSSTIENHLIMMSKACLQFIRWLFFNFRHNRDEGAKELYRQAYRNDNHNLRAYSSLQNLKNKMISRWHYKMLNDKGRNRAFKNAITESIRRRKNVTVIDIGSGTGLLSMYAANVASVRTVYAIECCEVMSKISEKVFSVNQRGKVVKLLTKHSTDVVIGEDVPEKATLIVSETLDCGAFGEGILETLIHAKENLLAIGGKIVPWKIQIHVAGYRSKTLSANQCLINNGIFESIFLGSFRLVAKSDEPYDAEYVQNIDDFKIITDVKAAVLEVDFNDLSSMQSHMCGGIEPQFELLVVDPDENYLDGLLTWFSLFLNNSDEKNIIKTSPKSNSCWQQAIFKMKKRIRVREDDVLRASISCANGVLTINHELDAEPDKVDLEVDKSAIHFLNDAEYLRELEFAIAKHTYPITSCLDYTPFPFVGLMLLKEGKISKLYCRKKDEVSIKLIAAVNLINDSCLEFLEDPIFKLPLKFDLILLHPFEPLGDLDRNIIVNYPNYSQMLSIQGLIVPHRITVYGELINSDFLVEASRVTDVDVKRFSIDTFINEYMTELHIDLDWSFKHEKLSSVFKLSDIYFDEEFHEKIVNVPVLNTKLPIQAILFHHKIKLTGNSSEFSTNRKSTLSCFKQTAAVLILESKRPVQQVSVSFHQNTGIVRCDVIG